MRVIPAAAVTGQACGLAAGMAIAEGILPGDLRVSDLQARLREMAIPLHIDELPPR
jgi:hypothetical protein